jgi:CO/xanthine dehydrogenase FAD-binding subunit
MDRWSSRVNSGSRRRQGLPLTKSAAVHIADPMNYWEKYYIAKDVGDALQALANSPGSVKIIAGGTDLLLDMRQGRHPPVHTLIDVTRIPEMMSLSIRNRELFIGASVTHKQIVESTHTLEHAQALVEACGLIGGPQVRNSATLGGNVAHALPAADGTIALMALDASAEVADYRGRRRVPLKELFSGPGKSTLRSNKEILVGFYLPLRTRGQASAFLRVMKPQGVAIAILNSCVWIEREGDSIKDLRIVLGPSGPVPMRMYGAEECLRGKLYEELTIKNAIHALLDDARFRTSKHRATEGYRRHLAGVLFRDTLEIVWSRAEPDV